jgi:hypothetical protein
MGRSDVHLFGSLKKHQTGKLFAADTDVKQAVSTWGLMCTICYPCATCVSSQYKVLRTRMFVALYIYIYIYIYIYDFKHFCVSCAVWNAEVLNGFTFKIWNVSVCWTPGELYMITAYCYVVVSSRLVRAFCEFHDRKAPEDMYCPLLLFCWQQMASNHPFCETALSLSVHVLLKLKECQIIFGCTFKDYSFSSNAEQCSRADRRTDLQAIEGDNRRLCVTVAIVTSQVISSTRSLFWNLNINCPAGTVVPALTLQSGSFHVGRTQRVWQ